MRIRHPHAPGERALTRLLAKSLTMAALLLSPATVLASASAAPAAHATAHTQAAPGRAAQPFDGFAHTLHVPKDYRTIQAAVDAARSGDLVLIAEGVYHEEVKVASQSAGITIRGMDRNKTILDGQSSAAGNGIYITADNVIVENLTIHHYRGNGIWWKNVNGYRGSYITAYDNGDYGIYARTSRRGEFNNDYASGNVDSGFYIGECIPCDALITNVTSEVNGLAYSGTNAGGNLVIKDSIWRNNMAGIVPNTQEGEKLYPQRGATIINNIVDSNNNLNAPGGPYQRTAHGIGIMLPGTNQNYVAKNTVTNHDQFGILVSGILGPQEFDKDAIDFWIPWGNVVTKNKVSHSGVADLGLDWPTGPGNCFSDNEAATTVPAFLEITHACGSPTKAIAGGDLSPTLKLYAVNNYASGSAYHAVDWRTVPAPPAQPSMPDVTAPRGEIFTEPFPVDLPNSGLPPQVSDYGPAVLEPLTPNGGFFWQLFLTLLTGVLPYALYVAWVGHLVLGLAKRTDLGEGKRLGLVTLVLGVPVIGPLLYQFVFKARAVPASPSAPAQPSTASVA